MPYPSDLTDDQWTLLEPVFNVPGKRGRKHAGDLRTVVDAILYIAQTGCQWRYLPASFGPWTRVWSQFSPLVAQRHLGALTVRHAAARVEDGRTEETPPWSSSTPTWPVALERRVDLRGPGRGQSGL